MPGAEHGRDPETGREGDDGDEAGLARGPAGAVPEHRIPHRHMGSRREHHQHEPDLGEEPERVGRGVERLEARRAEHDADEQLPDDDGQMEPARQRERRAGESDDADEGEESETHLPPLSPAPTRCPMMRPRPTDGDETRPPNRTGQHARGRMTSSDRTRSEHRRRRDGEAGREELGQGVEGGWSGGRRRGARGVPRRRRGPGGPVRLRPRGRSRCSRSCPRGRGRRRSDRRRAGSRVPSRRGRLRRPPWREWRRPPRRW